MSETFTKDINNTPQINQNELTLDETSLLGLDNTQPLGNRLSRFNFNDLLTKFFGEGQIFFRSYAEVEDLLNEEQTNISVAYIHENRSFYYFVSGDTSMGDNYSVINVPAYVGGNFIISDKGFISLSNLNEPPNLGDRSSVAIINGNLTLTHSNNNQNIIITTENGLTLSENNLFIFDTPPQVPVETNPSNNPLSTANVRFVQELIEPLEEQVNTSNNSIETLNTNTTNLTNQVNNILSLLSSDELTLDTLQEVVDFITTNRETLDTLSINNITGLTTELNNLENSIINLENNLGNATENSEVVVSDLESAINIPSLGLDNDGNTIYPPLRIARRAEYDIAGRAGQSYIWRKGDQTALQINRTHLMNRTGFGYASGGLSSKGITQHHVSTGMMGICDQDLIYPGGTILAGTLLAFRYITATAMQIHLTTEDAYSNINRIVPTNAVTATFTFLNDWVNGRHVIPNGLAKDGSQGMWVSQEKEVFLEHFGADYTYEPDFSTGSEIGGGTGLGSSQAYLNAFIYSNFFNQNKHVGPGFFLLDHHIDISIFGGDPTVIDNLIGSGEIESYFVCPSNNQSRDLDNRTYSFSQVSNNIITMVVPNGQSSPGVTSGTCVSMTSAVADTLGIPVGKYFLRKINRDINDFQFTLHEFLEDTQFGGRELLLNDTGGGSFNLPIYGGGVCIRTNSNNLTSRYSNVSFLADGQGGVLVERSSIRPNTGVSRIESIKDFNCYFGVLRQSTDYAFMNIIVTGTQRLNVNECFYYNAFGPGVSVTTNREDSISHACQCNVMLVDVAGAQFNRCGRWASRVSTMSINTRTPSGEGYSDFLGVSVATLVGFIREQLFHNINGGEPVAVFQGVHMNGAKAGIIINNGRFARVDSILFYAPNGISPRVNVTINNNLLQLDSPLPVGREIQTGERIATTRGNLGNLDQSQAYFVEVVSPTELRVYDNREDAINSNLDNGLELGENGLTEQIAILYGLTGLRNMPQIWLREGASAQVHDNNFTFNGDISNISVLVEDPFNVATFNSPTLISDNIFDAGFNAIVVNSQSMVGEGNIFTDAVSGEHVVINDLPTTINSPMVKTGNRYSKAIIPPKFPELDAYSNHEGPVDVGFTESSRSILSSEVGKSILAFIDSSNISGCWIERNANEPDKIVFRNANTIFAEMGPSGINIPNGNLTIGGVQYAGRTNPQTVETVVYDGPGPRENDIDLIVSDFTRTELLINRSDNPRIRRIRPGPGLIFPDNWRFIIRPANGINNFTLLSQDTDEGIFFNQHGQFREIVFSGTRDFVEILRNNARFVVSASSRTEVIPV